ncbi:MAG: hypothetical protein V2A79_13965 [Planctomycetota bacterium]
MSPIRTRHIEAVETHDEAAREANGLSDPRGPLWLECGACHRLRTIEEVADAAPGRDKAALWRCKKCGFEADGRDMWEYHTTLLLNITEEPTCPPVVREVLAECGQLLYRISRGDRKAIAEAGDAARHAARVLEHYADYEDWFHQAG